MQQEHGSPAPQETGVTTTGRASGKDHEMKHRKLIAFAGAAIIASSTPLIAGAPAAFAAAVPAATSIPFRITVDSCAATGTLSEDRDSNGAFVDVHVNSNPCGIGIEAGIEGPTGTPICWGGDVHQAGDSKTCHIPVNSGNHHGLRYWDVDINNWITIWFSAVRVI